MTKALTHIVTFSGGICSYCAAKRVIAKHGKKNIRLVFIDTLMEDEDLYRFLNDASKALDLPITTISRNKTPWQVFEETRFLGNSRVDPCSRILKREFFREWLEANYSPANARLTFGFDWNELHRLAKAEAGWKPWRINAPMTERPYLHKEHMLEEARSDGVEPPRLYAMGFAHNNCGGFCVKAGITHFVHLLKTMPERYNAHALAEEKLRKQLGANVSILLITRAGQRMPLTLTELRCRVAERDDTLPRDEWGGCGCMSLESLTNPGESPQGG